MALFTSPARREHQLTQVGLSSYLDGRVTERERARIERHLRACAQCAQDLRALQATVALLRRAPRRPAPRAFTLPHSVQTRQASYRRWNAAYGALRTASVVVTLLLVLFVSGDVLLSQGMLPYGQARQPAPEGVLMARGVIETTVLVEQQVQVAPAQEGEATEAEATEALALAQPEASPASEAAPLRAAQAPQAPEPPTPAATPLPMPKVSSA
ncbi:MAG: zf-HC2 domain-containing protein, partial [Chloroflexota bacterium]